MAVVTTDNFDRIVIQPQQQQQGAVVNVIQCPAGKTLKIYKIEYWNLYTGGDPVLYIQNTVRVAVAATALLMTTLKDEVIFPTQLVDTQNPINYIPKNENTMADPLFKLESGQFLNVDADGVFAVIVTMYQE